jgi:hypothetical protein
VNPLRLTGYGYKVFSQNDEDGIIAEIFKRIGVTDRSFVEFGVGNGIECNSLWLLLQGWSGLWIDASEQFCEQIRSAQASWLDNNSLMLCRSFITIDNINDVIALRYVDREIDILSVDVDYNDYWIWKAITVVKPRVVVVEYNAAWAPPAAMTVPYASEATWNGTNYFGASLCALAKLGNEKGYDLVGCCLAGVNAFFVRKDLAKGKFLKPGSAEEHYEPARYFLAQLPAGHPPGVGPVVIVE